jgi:hypothetical protein
MDKKTTGIIVTVVTAILCGCPGLAGLCIGFVASIASFSPDATDDPRSVLTGGLIFLCISLILIAIPVIVGILTLRKGPNSSGATLPDDPLPPPS